jgi:23S rRNA (uracil1939-C5)-methyltransferase
LNENSPQILTLIIVDLSRGGAGVGKEDGGRAVFVPFTAPGDVVSVELGEEKKNYAQARLIEILEPSPIRQKPPCPVFGRCGGCQWQHIPYDFQWKTKVNGVHQVLKRAALEVAQIEELPAEQIWEYRNRVQMRGEGGTLGFYQQGTNQIIPVERCDIARPEINSALTGICEEAKKFKNPYKVEIEVMADGEVIHAWNERHAASGFRQVHDGQNEKLKAWVASAIEGYGVLLDLYGGYGNLSLPLVSRMSEIHCVDFSSPTSTPGGMSPKLKFHRSAVVPWLKKFSSPSSAKVSVILDPPREGLGEDFESIGAALARLKASEIIAVGCDLDSWARDVTKFVKNGWKLKKVAALDLFPQTAHVETIAQLVL